MGGAAVTRKEGLSAIMGVALLAAESGNAIDIDAS